MSVSTIVAPEVLIERARKQAGSSDFGSDGWQEGLERLVTSVPIDIGPNPAGVATVEEIIVGRLVNRLRIERWYAELGPADIAPVR